MMLRARAAALLSAAAFAISAATAPAAGPDVIVGEIEGSTQWSFSGSVLAYSVGTVSCNIGDEPLDWIAESTRHPVIAQQMYRLHDGRIEQIGQAWLKHGLCALQNWTCGTCVPAGFFCEEALGVGCSDPYDVFLNGAQGGMGPKFEVNPATGGFNWPPTDLGQEGDEIYKRLQVRESELTVFDALYFVEAQYIHPQDAIAGNGNNNASYRRFTVGGTGSIFLQGPTVREKPAIHAWRDHGGGIDVEDPSVTLVNVDVPGDGRFIAGAKVIDNNDGTWRYEYAVHNLNSHRAGASLAIPLPRGAMVSGTRFHDVNYHSGEPFDNTDWSITIGADAVVFSSPQTFAENPNTNALRWSTLYNFSLTTDVPPAPGHLTLGLFRPGAPGEPDSMAIPLPVPSSPGTPCSAELTDDQPPHVDVFDLLAYLDLWFDADAAAERTDDAPPQIDVFDLLDYLDAWFEGC